MHMGGVSCGLAKASDCVNHELLLMKLKCYGIQCIARSGFISYLNNRRHAVDIKFPHTNHNTSSEWGILNHGVLQVSILEPLLFPIYMNDLPTTINS